MRMSSPSRTANSSSLDDIDRAIVDVLRRDGRITVNDLAEHIGLSASPTLRRLRRLEDGGVIRGYRAEVDPAAIGRSLTIWVTARLMVGDPDAQAGFEAGLAAIDAVSEVHHVTGDVDYLIRVDAADLTDYDRIVRVDLAELPGQAHITSYVVTSTALDRRW